MSHGLVAMEYERPGVGVWEFAMSKGDFIAVYAPRTMESFVSTTGDLWRSTLVRDVGDVFGPLPEIFDRLGIEREKYGRYEPEYDEQFIEMYKTCTGTMVATSTDVTDAEAVMMPADFERHLM
jgi:hypothetical protein